MSSEQEAGHEVWERPRFGDLLWLKVQRHDVRMSTMSTLLQISDECEWLKIVGWWKLWNWLNSEGEGVGSEEAGVEGIERFKDVVTKIEFSRKIQ